jgi:hypothetical protein
VPGAFRARSPGPRARRGPSLGEQIVRVALRILVAAAQAAADVADRPYVAAPGSASRPSCGKCGALGPRENGIASTARRSGTSCTDANSAPIAPQPGLTTAPSGCKHPIARWSYRHPTAGFRLLKSPALGQRRMGRARQKLRRARRELRLTATRAPSVSDRPKTILGLCRNSRVTLPIPMSTHPAPSMTAGIILWSKNRFNSDGGAGLRIR